MILSIEKELQEKNSFLQILHAVAVTANKAAGIKDAFEPILKVICQHTAWPIGHAYVVSKNNPDCLEPTTIWYLEHAERFADFRKATETTTFARGIGLPGRVFRDSKPHWIIDVTKDSGFLRAPFASAVGIKAGFAFPVMIGTEVAAVLEFFGKEAVKPDYILLGIMADVGIQLGQVIERKRAEEELTRLNISLEQRVAERTAELKRSNDELQQFAYVASHDLQEPLRMVSSYTQLLSRRYKDKLDSDAEEFINFAVDGASRMQNLINDLLEYSRVDSRGKALEPTDISIVLDKAKYNLQMAIEDSCAVITCDDLPSIIANSTQLIQLFQNLIGNAIKFCGELTPQVHISAEQQENEWLFSVRDNGIGIEQQYADRIFAIFQRLHKKTEYPGSGIGLAISKKIVELHGGRIWMESEPGKGTIIYLTIPIIEKGRQL